MTDPRTLDGRIVLVKSTRDRRNPPTALRGTLQVQPRPGAEKTQWPEIRIALEFPQMFTTRAHHRTIVLSEEQIAQLLNSERDGTFELTLDERLDPEASPGNE